MKKIKLTPRLAAVASFVNNCNTAADIGTDHGFVPVYLIQNGICKNAIASDINKGPLQSAVRTAHEYGVYNKLEFVCAPGLDGVKEGSVDTAVIAGMGGETIVGILDAAQWVKTYKTRLVLQPQSKLEMLEGYLSDNGFTVEKGFLVKDSGRLYIVLSVVYTGESNINQTYFTDVLKQDPLLNEYVSGILKKLSLRKTGLLAAAVRNEDVLSKINRYEEFLTSLIREE